MAKLDQNNIHPIEHYFQKHGGDLPGKTPAMNIELYEKLLPEPGERVIMSVETPKQLEWTKKQVESTQLPTMGYEGAQVKVLYYPTKIPGQFIEVSLYDLDDFQQPDFAGVKFSPEMLEEYQKNYDIK